MTVFNNVEAKTALTRALEPVLTTNPATGVVVPGPLDAGVYPNVWQYATDAQDIAQLNPINGRWVKSNTGTAAGTWNFIYPSALPQDEDQGIIDSAAVTGGQWIRDSGAGTTAPTLGAAKGVVLDSNKNLVASLATKQQIDQTAMQVATVAAALALTTNLNDKQLINIGGYYSNGDGGGGLYRVDLTDTTSPSDGGSVLVTSAGTRLKAIFDNDNINVRRFGAKVDNATNDNTAVQAALAYQQLSTGLAKTLFFPAGICRISQTIQASTRPLYIAGAGCAATTTSGSSTIRMITDNTPIIKYTNDNEQVTNIKLDYLNYQVAANTSAIGIWYAHNSYKSVTRRVYITKAAYGIYSAANDDAWQHSFWDSYINGFSISGVSLSGNGTEWSIGNLYVQNLVSPTGANMQRTIVSATRAGAQVSFTLSSLPDNIAVNRYIQVFGIDTFFDKVLVVKTLVGNVVTVDYTSDPGYNPTITASSKLQFAAQACTGPAFKLGYGMRVSLHAIDIEHVVTSDTYSVVLQGPSITIDKLYFEQLYNSGATHKFILHDQGNLTINNMEVANCGCLPGQAGTMFIEFNTSVSGSCNVGAYTQRDMAYTGASLVFCTKTGAGPDLQIDYIARGTTNRVNAVSTFTSFGNVKIPRTYVADNLPINGSSGSVAGITEAVTVTQSGTAGYICWDYYVTRATVGSGTQYVWRYIVDGSTIAYLQADGTTFITGPFTCTGSLISVTGAGARINCLSSTATASTFGGDTSTTSAVRLSYGAAVDRLLDLGGNSIQSIFRSTGAPANLIIQNAGGNFTIGNAAAGTGLIVGFSKGSTISIIKIVNSVVMVAGTVTVADTDTRSNTVIQANRKTIGGTPGFTSYTLNVGVGYTINSNSATDTSTFDLTVIHQ
jgi:hypothetical protein